MSTQTYRIGILGASGYTGADLIRILSGHPAIEISLLVGGRSAGRPLAEVFPHLGHLPLPDLISLDEVEWPGIDLDLIFCALPHAASQEVVMGLMHATGHSLLDELLIERREDLVAATQKDIRIIDLSADFRLDDPAVYEEWYGRPHQAVALQRGAIYGLPEFHRDALRSASLVACPGCYPTAALLALLPLLEAAAIGPDEIIIDAKSGVTGAGRSLKESMLFCEISEAMHPYGLGRHRHMPEMEQEMAKAAGRPVGLSFTPHLVPMNRGELETIYVRLARGRSADDLRTILAERYADEPFVRVAEPGVVPATRHVRGSNQCLINVFEDRIAGRAIIVSVIDNLVKGSSGQAVQAMNLMLGLPETTGLMQAPLFP
ncbi:N-acetyl-gamma-glutamyl-phosphate reductase [Iodidimonas nitroreducens]|uniref:N-acetyl-gamma-glutamyl-phosphate reductase n=1 Tax=Iodidimonas nitroreducens TaxID=1236968 RepID=A0A5A7N9H9_9PROT|nr:N-acetyl-gamma-glutamyl-phosphate reductase [Iodidimonas nitroreducens]GAK32524.1 N-acetyl-gamma-glutamyl-phosphate reductase [alpha proteobacterium Q-1]GER04587.1 N-acetyl-gamma-glutamyl-phosphate reductase [Iodidimonas nitroreducens]